MCTLIFGIDVLGPSTVIIGTNRDEDPARPSEPPQVLCRSPLVVGGRDARAGGTWLALRGDGAGVAMLLNRHNPTPDEPGRRSRGLLTLDVASSMNPLTTAVAESAGTRRYAPCSLVWLSPEEAWILSFRVGHKPTIEHIPPGWHAITHFELDDATDRRAVSALERLASWRPASRAEAETRLTAMLASHGEPEREVPPELEPLGEWRPETPLEEESRLEGMLASFGRKSEPAFCIHEGRAPTVSSAMLWLTPWELSYRHAQGRPCVTPYEDWTHLTR
jgi:hypothetical protein